MATETQVRTIGARRIAAARNITVAAAAQVLDANPGVLAMLRVEINALSPEQLAAEDKLEGPDKS